MQREFGFDISNDDASLLRNVNNNIANGLSLTQRAAVEVLITYDINSLTTKHLPEDLINYLNELNRCHQHGPWGSNLRFFGSERRNLPAPEETIASESNRQNLPAPVTPPTATRNKYSCNIM